MATRRVELGPTGQTVRENIGRVRRDRRLTLRGVAERMLESGRPLAYNTLSEIERGARRVDVDDLIAIAVALDVSPNALLLPARSDESEIIEISGAADDSVRNFSDFLYGMRSLTGGGFDFLVGSIPTFVPLTRWMFGASDQDRPPVWIRRLAESDGSTVKWRSGISEVSRIDDLTLPEDH